MLTFKPTPRQQGTPFTIPADPDDPWQSEADGELSPIKRAVLVVRPRQPYANWVRKTRQQPDYNLAISRREDTLAYLIPGTNCNYSGVVIRY